MLNIGASFTKTEKQLLVFLLCGMAIGSVFMWFNEPDQSQPLFLEAQSQASGVPARSTATAPTSEKPGPEAELTKGLDEQGRLDINIATAEMMETLPDVGPSMASAIVSHRAAHGPFQSAADLGEVRGIGSATLATLEPLITARNSITANGSVPKKAEEPSRPLQSVLRAAPNMMMPANAVPVIAAGDNIGQASLTGAAGSSGASAGTVNINTASAAQLDSLKGIGPALAGRIIQHRIRVGGFRSVEALVDVKGVGSKILEDNRSRLSVH